MGLALAYGIMFIDNVYNIWSRWGLDYSTHTAVSLVLVTYLSLLVPRWLLLWQLSFFSYCGLMLYQKYHTVADILSTGVTLAVGIGGLLYILSILLKCFVSRGEQRLAIALPLLLRIYKS